MSCWVWCVHQFWHAWNWWTCVLVWIFMVLCFPHVKLVTQDLSKKRVGWAMFLQESKCASEASPRSVAPTAETERPESASERKHAEPQGSLATNKKLPNFVPPTTSPSTPRASADRPSLLALAVKRQHLQQMLLGFYIFLDAGGDIFISSHGIQGSRLPRWGRKNKLPKVWLRPTLQVLWATWSISCQNIHGLRLF